MLWKEFSENNLDSVGNVICERCPLYQEGMCDGEVKSDSGGFWEGFPCDNFEDDTDLDKYIGISTIISFEEEDKNLKEKRRLHNKEIGQQKRRYITDYCFAENYRVRDLNKKLKILQFLLKKAKQYAIRYNTLTEVLELDRPKAIVEDKELKQQIVKINQDIEKAKKILRLKQKECRESEGYRAIK